jgi:hypothetical protein
MGQRIVCGLCFVVLIIARPARAAEPPTSPAPANPQPGDEAPPEEPYMPLLPLPLGVEGELSNQPHTVTIEDAGPAGTFPLPPPAERARFLMVDLSLGPGWLALHDQLGRDGQGAMAMAARVSVMLAPDWCVFVAADHVRTERGGATFSQTAGLLGLQRYVLGRLYLGAAVAVGEVKESSVTRNRSQGPGDGASAFLGIEVLRGPNLALTAEVAVTLIEYPDESWEMGGVRLGVATF